MVKLKWELYELSPTEKAVIVKEGVTISDVLRAYANIEPHNNRCDCPLCSGTRRDTFTLIPAKNRFKCHRCGENGSVIDLAMAVLNLDFKEAVNKLYADFCAVHNAGAPGQAHAAFQAATALREERERQNREAAENFHRWRDLWIVYDRWRTTFPPGHPLHDEAERNLATVSYLWDCAEDALNKLRQ